MGIDWAAMSWVLYIAHWIIFVAALYFVPHNRKPASATAWLLLIFLMPYLGLLLFWVLGSPKLSPRRRALQRTMDEVVHRFVANASHDPQLAPIFAPSIPPRYAPFVRLNANLGDMPAFSGNTVQLLPDYDAAIRTIAAAIDTAERYVHVEYFILAHGPDDRGRLRRPGARRQARRAGAHPARSSRLRGVPRAQGDACPHGGRRLRLALDAQGRRRRRHMEPPRPAQPPQDRGRGRQRRVYRLAEHDRQDLPGGQEPQARPVLCGARRAGDGTGRRAARRGLPHRLVLRDPRRHRPQHRSAECVRASP